jgi:DNA-binding HxlR family transcriptional regulator
MAEGTAQPTHDDVPPPLFCDRPGTDPKMTCPVTAAVGAIGGKWKPIIVFYLLERTHRFGELRRRIPNATQQMLTLQLRELERDGVVRRHVYREVPPKVEYSLTPLGQRLEPVVRALSSWGSAYVARDA